MKTEVKRYHYVYRITNIKEKRHYIGVRSSYCIPSEDLGISYFGSSNDAFILHQKRNRNEYAYYVIQLFDTRELANAHERYLHEIYNVGTSVRFFNGRNQSSENWCTAGKRKLNDGKVEIFVKPDDVNKYLELGYLMGRIERKYTQLRTTVINDGNFEYKILPEETDQYVANGYLLGGLPMKEIQKFKLSLSHTGKTLTQEHKDNIGIGCSKPKSENMKAKLSETRTGLIYINNSITEKIINPINLIDYVYDGWKEGKLPMPEHQKEAISKGSIGKPGTIDGKIRINDGKTEKFIFKNELDEYLELGWLLGNNINRSPIDYSERKGTTTGKIGINNGIKNKFIFKEELDEYLSNGWIKGLKPIKSKATKNDIA